MFRLALLLLFPVTAFAQKGLTFGLRIAPNVSFTRAFVNDVALQDEGTRVGVTGGARLHYGFSDNVGIATGLEVTNLRTGAVVVGGENWSVDPEYPNNPIELYPFRTTNLSLTYLSVPMMLQGISYDLGGGWYFKGAAGIIADFRVGARITDENDERLKFNEGTRGANLAAAASLGLEYDVLKAGYLDIELRYRHGLFNVLDPDYVTSDAAMPFVGPGQPFRVGSYKLSDLALHVGFIFR